MSFKTLKIIKGYSEEVLHNVQLIGDATLLSVIDPYQNTILVSISDAKFTFWNNQIEICGHSKDAEKHSFVKLILSNQE